MNRLFIALDLPQKTLNDIVSIRDSIFGKGKPPKWEGKDNLHLTLKFLGSIKPERNSEIISVIERHISEMRLCAGEYKNYGLFSRNQGVAILWMGFQIDKALFSFIENIENDLVKIGFQKEKRAFRPHLTLLRIKNKDNFDKVDEFKNYELENKKFTFTSVSLIKSEFKRNSSVYTKIKSFELT